MSIEQYKNRKKQNMNRHSSQQGDTLESQQLKKQASKEWRESLADSGKYDIDTIDKMVEIFDRVADNYIFRLKK